MKSIAEKSLVITSLFESEVFVQLMLWKWGHPFADDKAFANDLLEDASMILREAIEGVQVLPDIPANDLNFVAAVWYAERLAVDQERDEVESIPAREAWLLAVRKTIPSCFCNPSDLG